MTLSVQYGSMVVEINKKSVIAVKAMINGILMSSLWENFSIITIK